MAFTLQSANLLRDYGGTARVADPETTFRNLAEARKFVGISRLANITGLDCVGVPTWMAIRPLARSVTVSQGKGVTHAAAKVSAIMEAIEVFHAEHLLPPGEELTLEEAAQSDRFVDLSFLPIRQNANLSKARPVAWIAGKCLITGEVYWLPREMIDLDLVDRCEEEDLFVSSSNGLASGNSLEEATIHAICEVIERDHSAFFEMKQTLAPYMQGSRVAPSTIDDPTSRDVLDKIERAGLNTAIWSMMGALGMPCFTCDIYDENHATLYPIRATGAGCHPKKHIAMLRALTEALQSRLTFVAGARDDIYWSTYLNDIPMDALRNRTWVEQCQYEALQVDFEDVEDFGSGTNDAQKAVDEILTALKASGFNCVILTELTCEPIGVPVVHVFIPGMEPPLENDEYCPGPRMMEFLEEIVQS